MARLAIMAERNFATFGAKTATGVLRYRGSEVVAVIDSTKAGQDAATALGMDLGRGIPVVADVAQALRQRPDTLVIGINPSNDLLYPYWRDQILLAIEAGLDIHSGLHFRLGGDEQLAAAAARAGVRLWDVRQPAAPARVARFLPRRPGNRTVLAVGSDGTAGKMTTMLELDRAARQSGMSSTFLATGQTGILICGSGLPADAIASDFLAGAVEEQVIECAERFDWTFVEGQGALNHPAYSAVTLGLIHGARPDAMILCHRAGATAIRGWPRCPLPPLERIIRMNEEATGWLDAAAPVLGISLVTVELPIGQAREAARQIEASTGLPTTDVLRFGAEALLEALRRWDQQRSATRPPNEAL
jgi:uncharacterized NAD-dependent epimerase/dehydratase family protein